MNDKVKCSDIIAKLELLSPPQNACSWDNVGLLVGRRNQDVYKILIALDATKEVVKEAVNQKADLLITHHPMIFTAMKKINEDSVCGSKILDLAENHIAYYAMHTNFDILGGMAEIASERMQLHNSKPLEYMSDKEDIGLGCIGDSAESMDLRMCAELVKKQFSLSEVAVYGDMNQQINRIAICPGSGKSMISLAKEQGAQVLITGDIGHHEGLDAIEMGLAVIDATHFGLESVFSEYIKQYLDAQISGVEIYTYDEKRPFSLV